LHLIRVTNDLQPLGKERALAIIGEYARIRDVGVDETWLFLLLRTLFDVPQPPGHMPDMYIGAMSPAPPEDRLRIPRFPIVIVDDIPFSLLWGVTLAGEAEPVTRHVEYFRQHGGIRAAKLRPPDDPYPSFKKLLQSKEWAEMAKAEKNAPLTTHLKRGSHSAIRAHPTTIGTTRSFWRRVHDGTTHSRCMSVGTVRTKASGTWQTSTSDLWHHPLIGHRLRAS
jgi:hypothetical protein